MKIAIESFWLNTKQLTGVGYYTYYTLLEINKIDPSNTYYLLYTGKKWEGPNLGNNFIPVCYGKGKATFAIWFNLHKIIKKINPDLYHATFPTRVPPQKLPCSTITTVHDLLALHIESKFEKFRFNLTTYHAWKNSTHFLCNSYYTANEIQTLKHIPKGKISVTYLAPSHKIKNWESPGKHLLFVGSMIHRKNPIFLIKVYINLCTIMQKPPPIIFVGHDFGGLKNEIYKEMQKCPANGKIEWLEYVDSNVLSQLYAEAALYILPSKLEGFGIPVIEAMSAGVPVLCSDLPIFREIAGNSIEMVSSWNIKEWTKKIKLLLLDLDKRKRLSITGISKSQEYNWTKCAQLTYEIYQKYNKLRLH